MLNDDEGYREKNKQGRESNQDNEVIFKLYEIIDVNMTVLTCHIFILT